MCETGIAAPLGNIKPHDCRSHEYWLSTCDPPCSLAPTCERSLHCLMSMSQWALTSRLGNGSLAARKPLAMFSICRAPDSCREQAVIVRQVGTVTSRMLILKHTVTFMMWYRAIDTVCKGGTSSEMLDLAAYSCRFMSDVPADAQLSNGIFT